MTTIELSLVLIIVLLLFINLYLFMRKRFSIKNVPTDVAEYMVMLNDNICDNNNKHNDSLSNVSKALNTLEQRLTKNFHSYTDKVIDSSSNNEITLNKTVGVLKNNLESVSSELTEIKNQLNALQQYTIEKEKKIRRFEEGYDYKIKNRMITDIISLLDDLEKQNKKSPNENIEESIEDILLLLENNGINSINIDGNIPYMGNEQIAKVDKVEETTDSQLNGIIKETIKKGFYLDIEDGTQKIIRPCSVVIYKLIKGEE